MLDNSRISPREANNLDSIKFIAESKFRTFSLMNIVTAVGSEWYVTPATPTVTEPRWTAKSKYSCIDSFKPSSSRNDF